MIIPFIHTNAGATSNGMLSVQIVDDLGNDQSWIGVLGQEVFEVRWKWAHLPQVLASIVGDGREFYGDMEIRSHMVEAVVAERFDGRSFAQYCDLMLTMLDHPHGYRQVDGYFQGMTRGDLEIAMKSHYHEAVQWVSDNASFFAKWKQRRAA